MSTDLLATAVTLRRCKLVRVGIDGSVAEYIFDQPSVTLGSSDDNDLVIDDDKVSGEHARVFQDGDDFLMEDVGSTNGTYINNVRVRTAYLKSGCSIRLGGTQLRFSLLSQRVEITPSQRQSLGPIVGKSERMRRLFGVIEKIAPTGVTVVLEGETGTGKEVVARTVHQYSSRANNTFIVFDCGAVQQNLIESELFGHEKGSFTGALAGRQGLFEMAHGGTIFLDEIGELALDLQPKLLRALEQREIRRVGGNRPIKIDVRIIAATNRTLADEVEAGRFREDLYYRLSVVRLQLPPLRERREDVPLLVRHILKTGSFNRIADGQRVKGIATAALEALMRYEWPGNVRELANVVERACSFADGEFVQLEDLPDHIAGVRVSRSRGAKQATEPLRAPVVPVHADRTFKLAKESWLASFEKEYLETLLTKHSGNLSQAAREADVDRKHFRRLARKYGLVSGPTKTKTSD
ncbi:MAG: sigma 54-interacting transcriptional regulator [Myxococcales bacterium]|nr:sigma 54-interacting transcriptional regulator [Myxococcales bacterium]